MYGGRYAVPEPLRAAVPAPRQYSHNNTKKNDVRLQLGWCPQSVSSLEVPWTGEVSQARWPGARGRRGLNNVIPVPKGAHGENMLKNVPTSSFNVLCR
jgi:hypothetical protein